jgi:hypothetical protein
MQPSIGVIDWISKNVIPNIYFEQTSSRNGTTSYQIQTFTTLTNFLPRQLIKSFFLPSLLY